MPTEINDAEVERIAQLCHEANRGLCVAFGDQTQLPWDSAADWQRASVIQGVRFLVANPDAGPDATHAAWTKTKLDAGWIYGAVKDPEAKTHPCLVPFEQLPPEQRAKDYVFLAIVREALRRGPDRKRKG